MTEITLKLLPSTIEVIGSPKPTTIFIGGRGASKSFSGSLWVIMKLIAEPGMVYGCFAPTHQQAISVMLPNLISHLETLQLTYTWNKKPAFRKSRYQKHDNVLSIDIPGSEWCSQIVIGTAESYDYQRGKEFAGLWCDEVRDFRKDAINVFIGCLRGFGERVYPKLYTTTPNGFDHIYSEYLEKPRDDVKVIRSASHDNIFLPQSFFDELKNNYSSKFYDQEVLGKIINFTVGQVVWSYNRDKHNSTEKIEGDHFLSCDFNIAPMCWAYGKYNKNNIHVDGEIVLLDSARTADAIDKWMALHPKQSKVYIYGDASGKSGSTRGNKSDYDIISDALKAKGYQPIIRLPKGNPSHVDRFNVFNKTMENDVITFDPSCHHLFKDFHNAIWKEGTRSMDKKYDPHMLDAFSYFVWYEYGKEKPTIYQH